MGCPPESVNYTLEHLYGAGSSLTFNTEIQWRGSNIEFSGFACVISYGTSLQYKLGLFEWKFLFFSGAFYAMSINMKEKMHEKLAITITV